VSLLLAGGEFMSKYHDDRSHASDPGKINFAIERYRAVEPAANGLWGWFHRTFRGGGQFEEMLAEHLLLGDSRAACVVSLEPLLVAAYTDELDCIAMLQFPSRLAAEHALKPGGRLLTVNTYEAGSHVAADLMPGPSNMENYTNFFPVIADFFSDDHQRIARRKSEIPEEEWQRCLAMGADYRRRFPQRWRNGSPLWSCMSAT
jgi:hypothetical protein